MADHTQLSSSSYNMDENTQPFSYSQPPPTYDSSLTEEDEELNRRNRDHLGDEQPIPVEEGSFYSVSTLSLPSPINSANNSPLLFATNLGKDGGRGKGKSRGRGRGRGRGRSGSTSPNPLAAANRIMVRNQGTSRDHAAMNAANNALSNTTNSATNNTSSNTTTSATNNASNNTTNNITDKNQRKGGSWVWNWATHNDDEKTVYCNICGHEWNIENCQGSTTTIGTHLKKQHRLTEEGTRNGASPSVTGPLDNFLATQGNKRAPAWEADDWVRKLCRLVVCGQYPFTLPESPLFRDVCLTAQKAPSADYLKFPSNDTMTRR
ncbi:hypothetical protein BGZ92_005177, partial [Podila epicladia]